MQDFSVLGASLAITNDGQRVWAHAKKAQSTNSSVLAIDQTSKGIWEITKNINLGVAGNVTISSGGMHDMFAINLASFTSPQRKEVY